MMGQESRQTTSNIGHLNKASIQVNFTFCLFIINLIESKFKALIHGLNRHYYSIAINYRKNELEQKMLLNLHKKAWTEGLHLHDFKDHEEKNAKLVKVNNLINILFEFTLTNLILKKEMLELAKNYNKAIQEEEKLTKEKLAIHNVGKLDPKRHLLQDIEQLMASNISQMLGSMMDTITF